MLQLYCNWGCNGGVALHKVSQRHTHSTNWVFQYPSQKVMAQPAIKTESPAHKADALTIELITKQLE